MYEVILFGDTPILDGIARGHVQNMGTGNALSSYLQLPGGGWYNNYRGRKTPQGIRPITKQGRLYGTNAENAEKVATFRSLLGVEDRLTIRWYTGALWWQLATLINVDAPTTSQMKGGWIDYTLSWVSAAQNWRGVVYDEEDWTWGDESWLFGDGTAEMGVGAQDFDLADADETITVSHGGNIDAPNVTLRFAFTGTWQDVTVINQTTGQQIILERGAGDTTPGLEINAGAQSIYRLGTPRTATLSRSLNTLNITTGSAHGLTAGRPIRISDSDEYSGDYYPSTVPTTTTASVPLPPSHTGYGADTGTLTGLTDLFGNVTFSDISRWMVMAPGDNVLRVMLDPMPTTATLTAEFVNHYG